MRVLGEPAALIRVKEDVINIERRGNERLVVGSGGLGAGSSEIAVDGEEALIKRAELKVNLDLVVLEGNQRQSQTRVAAEPELKGHVEGRLREGIARGAHLLGGTSVARTINIRVRRIRQIRQLGGLANHLVVSGLLLSGERQLAPDVHPVTILAVNALATDLNLNEGDHLLAGVIKPAGERGIRLGDLREGDLEIRAVGEITIAADRALHTATEVSLAVESLLNSLHREVGVATIGDLPEGNLGVTGEINVLCAIGDELHKSTCHSSFS